MPRLIYAIATMDTKGEEIAFVARQAIEAHGFNGLVFHATGTGEENNSPQSLTTP